MFNHKKCIISKEILSYSINTRLLYYKSIKGEYENLDVFECDNYIKRYHEFSCLVKKMIRGEKKLTNQALKKFF